MANIKIITDTASDIPQYLVDELHITMLPICVVMDGKVYQDRYEIDSRDYLKKLRTLNEIPTTTMVPVHMVEEEFRKNLDAYDYQIYVTMSSKASGGNGAAHMVKDQLEEELGKKSNIIIIDSMSLSMDFGKCVIAIAELAQQGAELETLLETYEQRRQATRAYFMVDDLRHLQKGGRIKPGMAIVGGLLGIKPILTIQDGLVDAIGKERGKQKAIERIVSMAAAEIDGPQDAKIWIANGDADEGCEEAIRLVKEQINPREIELYHLGCTIGTHSGAGLVGIIFDRRV